MTIDLTKPAVPVAPFAVPLPHDPRTNAVIMEEARAAVAAKRSAVMQRESELIARLVAKWKRMFCTDSALSPSHNVRNGVRAQIMVTWNGPQFRNERYVDEVMPRAFTHQGWYADVDCMRTYRGFVFSLSHGRFGSGHACNDTGERVYFLDVFTDERAAASHADDEARYVAEEEEKHDERQRAAQALDEKIAEATDRLRCYLSARNDKRTAARDLAGMELDVLRSLKTERATYSDIEV